MRNVRVHPIIVDSQRITPSRRPREQTIRSEPVCFILNRTSDDKSPVYSSTAVGVVMVRPVTIDRRPSLIATVAVHGLSDPTDYGDFDTYEAMLTAGDEREVFTWPLDETAELIPTWSGTSEPIVKKQMPFPVTLSVRPINLETNESGRPVVRGRSV